MNKNLSSPLVAIAVFSCLIVGAPGQGLVIKQETTSSGMSSGGQSGGERIETIYFGPNAIRHTAADGSDSIIQFELGKFINIDHKKKTYSELTFEELQRRADEAAREMAGDEQAMQAMRQILGAQAGQVSITDEGPGEPILGHATHKHVINMPPVRLELWAAPDLEMPAPYYDSLKLKAPANPLLDMGQLYDAFKQVKGVPLKTVMTMNMMGMNMNTTTVATSIEKVPVAPATFDIPAGYKKNESP